MDGPFGNYKMGGKSGLHWSSTQHGLLTELQATSKCTFEMGVILPDKGFVFLSIHAGHLNNPARHAKTKAHVIMNIPV